MADIASSDVAYTEITGAKVAPSAGSPKYKNTVQLVFGNNALTYPTGGIPLDANKLGMPNGIVDSLIVFDQGANAKGYKFEFVKASNKLKICVEDTVATNTPLKEHTNATFIPNPATILALVEGN